MNYSPLKKRGCDTILLKAVALYHKAYAAGSKEATQRLLNLYEEGHYVAYNPAITEKLTNQLYYSQPIESFKIEKHSDGDITLEDRTNCLTYRCRQSFDSEYDCERQNQ